MNRPGENKVPERRTKNGREDQIRLHQRRSTRHGYETNSGRYIVGHEDEHEEEGEEDGGAV
jgi:hypothetical protein